MSAENKKGCSVGRHEGRDSTLNREILFRGKRADTGEWVEGYYAILPTDEGEPEHVIIETFDECDVLYHFPPVDSETVGQYTGLTDKNGKRIFEWDVLQFGERRLMVWWNGEAFQWQAKSIRGYDVIPYEFSVGGDWTNIDLGNIYAEVPITGDMTTEIIGNIYDNPELVE